MGTGHAGCSGTFLGGMISSRQAARGNSRFGGILRIGDGSGSGWGQISVAISIRLADVDQGCAAHLLEGESGPIAAAGTDDDTNATEMLDRSYAAGRAMADGLLNAGGARRR